MRSTSFVTFALCALSATVLSAPTPQFDNIIGSITHPSAGNDNIFKDNGNHNGNGNGNDNEAGNENGNHNQAGTGNSAGNGNTFNLPSLKDSLKERKAGYDEISDIADITNTIGSITEPSAGTGNRFLGNGNGNGNDNGNGNSAGNGNGNGNQAGTGNEAGNGNTFNVSPETELPDVHFPDINFAPTINLARRDTKAVA